MKKTNYQKPDLIDYNARRAAGTCAQGSGNTTDSCFIGGSASTICGLGNIADYACDEGGIGEHL